MIDRIQQSTTHTRPSFVPVSGPHRLATSIIVLLVEARFGSTSYQRMLLLWNNNTTISTLSRDSGAQPTLMTLLLRQNNNNQRRNHLCTVPSSGSGRNHKGCRTFNHTPNRRHAARAVPSQDHLPRRRTPTSILAHCGARMGIPTTSAMTCR